MRILPQISDDALLFATRRLFSNGSRALAIPQAVDKVRAINDPEYEPNPNLSYIRKAMSAVGKIAEHDQNDIHADNQEHVLRPYSLGTWTPWGQRNPQNRISEAINTNSGWMFKNKMMDESTTDPGSQMKTAVHEVQKLTTPQMSAQMQKKADSGNLQGAIGDMPPKNEFPWNNGLDPTENRGGASDHSKQMWSHAKDTLAGGSLTQPDISKKVWDHLRAYLGHDATTMNIPGDDAAPNLSF